MAKYSDDDYGIGLGSRVWFAEEKRPYTVMAIGARYAVCTKPFAARATVMYTIIDIERSVRGPNNLIFNPYDYKSREGCERCLSELESGDCEISSRRQVPLMFRERLDG